MCLIKIIESHYGVILFTKIFNSHRTPNLCRLENCLVKSRVGNSRVTENQNKENVAIMKSSVLALIDEKCSRTKQKRFSAKRDRATEYKY